MWTLLQKYSRKSSGLKICCEELSPLVDQILKGTFSGPLEQVPCARFAAEGGFDQWSDLNLAYADFYVAVTDLDEATVV